jgi:adenosylcobinamide-GDP ribazoletransferase
VHACLPGTLPARPGGFGALVVGRARPVTVIALTGGVLAGGAAIAWLAGASPLWWPLAQLVALAVAALLCAHAKRRLDGLTGDVFGALVEVATATCLTVIALTH